MKADNQIMVTGEHLTRFFKFRREKIGLPPGSFTFGSDQEPVKSQIFCLSYNANNLDDRTVAKVEDCLDEARNHNTVTWVDIAGLSDPQTIEEVGKLFGVHRLWLEDVLSIDHRPKVDELNDLLFLIIKAVNRNEETGKFDFEQVSLFMGDGFVLSFQEKPKDTLDRVKSRIRENKGRIRSAKEDYLIYALVDSIVDDYYLVLHELGIKIEKLEGEINNELKANIPARITELNNDLLYLSRALVPIRETLAQICRSLRGDIEEETKVYFKDAHEHADHLVETINDYRQMANSLLNFYESCVNTKLNEIMKVMTIFASLFIPLTFIAGIFGMNFENMPELKWEYGYYYTWGLMIVVAISMLYMFKRKKWL